MKLKYLLTFVIISILSNSIFSQTNNNSRILFYSDISFQNSHSLYSEDKKNNYEISPNIIVGADVNMLIFPEMNYGIGLNYTLPNKIINTNSSYSFLPIYIFGQYKILKSFEKSLSIQIRLGYNLFNPDTSYIGENGSSSGGFYYSINISLGIYKSLKLRTSYSCNYGESEINKKEYLVKNSFFSFGLGISF